MTNDEKLAKILAIIKPLADKEVWFDEDPGATVYDYAGGNFDDAFGGGFTAGKTQTARDILDAIK